MVLLAYCIPCQVGHHERHYEVIQAVPPGVIGGARCRCQGECVERNQVKIDKDAQALVDHFNKLHNSSPGESGEVADVPTQDAEQGRRASPGNFEVEREEQMQALLETVRDGAGHIGRLQVCPGCQLRTVLAVLKEHKDDDIFLGAVEIALGRVRTFGSVEIPRGSDG